MSDQIPSPRAEDVFSVGTRISWGAILGGAVVAFALYLMFTTVGVAVGLTMSDSIVSTTASNAAIIWGILTFAIAVFVGGLMTSLYTTGENPTEAVFSGIIMWALVIGLLIHMASAGLSHGFHAAIGLHNQPHAQTPNWQISAREAGVPNDVVEDWVRKAFLKSNDPQYQAEVKAKAKYIAWAAFGGTWLSMIAAAMGAWVGAGPTFRIVSTTRFVRPVGP